MTRIIYNADDFGYSEAVTLGIIKAHRDGMIKTTTLMTNMPAAAMAAQLAHENPDLYVGQHTNIVVGRPCSRVEDVSSLVDGNGFFNTKARIGNKENLDPDDIERETMAQAERFRQLMGYYPTHIEGHAIRDRGLFAAIKNCATKLKVHYTDCERDMQGNVLSDQNHSGYEIPEFPEVMYYMENVSIEYWLEDRGHLLSKDLVEMHTHPGYIDQYLLDHSSYNIPRAKEAEIACHPALRQWRNKHQVQFITFADIKKK